MPDDDKPREFPVEVTVGNIKVTVTLLLKPGTTVERKPEPEQKPPEPDIIAR